MSFILTLIVMAVMLVAVLGVLMRHARSPLLLVPLLAVVVIYAVLGRVHLPDQPLASRGAELAEKARIESTRQTAAREALASAEAVLKDNPQNIVAMLFLAEAAAEAGEYAREVAILTEAYTATQNSTIRAMLAEALTRQADGIVTETAAKLLRQTMSETPDDWRAPYLYALYESQQGNHQQAIILWQELARQVAETAEGETMLALINHELRDIAKKLGQKPEALLIPSLEASTPSTPPTP